MSEVQAIDDMRFEDLFLKLQGVIDETRLTRYCVFEHETGLMRILSFIEEAGIQSLMRLRELERNNEPTS